jgi:hypothetical protein
VVEEAVLPWADVGLTPAQGGAPAFGPDRLVAGPEGMAAVYDTVGQRVIVLSDLAISTTVRAERVTDLAFTGDGDLVVLQDRTVSLLDLRGTVFDKLEAPDLVGPASAVRVDGDAIWATDTFGQWHRIGKINVRDLVPAEAATRAKTVLEIAVDAPKSTVVVDGAPYKVPKVTAAEARAVEHGSRRWIVLDAVVATPAGKDRTAWIDGRSAPLPTVGLYAPADDLAVDLDGRLWAISPQSDGLHVLRLSP